MRSAFSRLLPATWLVLCFAALPVRSEPPTIGTDALIAKLSGSANAGRPTVIDVRSWVEFQDAHVAGAIHIPSDSVAQRLPEKVRDKKRELVFYCGGPRCPNSRQAAEAAIELGYSRVAYYQEGLAAWQAAKAPVEAGSPLPVITPVFVTSKEVLPALEQPRPDLVVVDVRSRKEYGAFHLDRSMNIPLDELEEKSKKLKGKKIVLVCHAGGQSLVAARLLSKTGRKDMCVLKGGLVEWQRARLPHLVGQTP